MRTSRVNFISLKRFRRVREIEIQYEPLQMNGHYCRQNVSVIIACRYGVLTINPNAQTNIYRERNYAEGKQK